MARPCSSAGSRTDAAIRICVPPDRATASMAGRSMRSPRSVRIRSDIRRSCGASKTPASPSSRSSVACRGLHRVQSRRTRCGARAHRGLPQLRAPRPRHAARRQGRRAAAAAHQRQLCLLHRPLTDSGAHVWISFSPDLRNWGGHKLVLPARRGAWWDANRVGLSPPLIETPRGWLMLYHGVRRTAAGACIGWAWRSWTWRPPSTASCAVTPGSFGPRGAV